MRYKKHIEGLKKGSYKDFNILYNTFYSNLYGFVLSLVKSKDLAQEIVHESFISLWTNREQLNPEFSFKSYLYTISKNRIIDSYRRQIQNPNIENYVDYCNNLKLSYNNITTKIDYDSFVKKLDSAKSKLTPQQAKIFEMSKEEGMTSSEIAEELGLSEQTIYNVLSTALKKIKKELGSSGLFLLLLFFQ